MKKTLLYSFAFAMFAVVLVDGLRQANSYSGNPPEVLLSIVKDGSGPTCNSCHGNGNTGKIATTGGITVTKQDANLYANGIEYDLSVSIDEETSRHGFQFIALDDQGNSAGSFSEDDANISVEDDAVDGVSHVSHNNIPNSNSGTFQFKWTTPASYQGPITFHMIGVAADGNASNSGDKVYYDTMMLQYDAAVSVSDLALAPVTMYPNPATSYVIVEDPTDSWEHMNIFSMDGVLVQSVDLFDQTSTRIDLGDYRSGIYFVNLSDSNGQSSTRKLIVR